MQDRISVFTLIEFIFAPESLAKNDLTREKAKEMQWKALVVKTSFLQHFTLELATHFRLC